MWEIWLFTETDWQEPARCVAAVVEVLIIQDPSQGRPLEEDQVQRQPGPVQHRIDEQRKRFEGQAFAEQGEYDTEQ